MTSGLNLCERKKPKDNDNLKKKKKKKFSEIFGERQVAVLFFVVGWAGNNGIEENKYSVSFVGWMAEQDVTKF